MNENIIVDSVDVNINSLHLREESLLTKKFISSSKWILNDHYVFKNETQSQKYLSILSNISELSDVTGQAQAKKKIK